MKKAAPFLVLISSLCWASTGIITRYTGTIGFTVVQNSAMRIFCAAVALVLFLLITDRGKLKIKRKDFKWFAACGIFSLLMNNLSYSATVQLASLSVAVVLLYTSPIFVMILSFIIFKEKLTVHKLTAAAMAFAGCLLTVGLSGSHPGSNPGLVLATGLAAGLGFGLYSIFGKFLVGRYAPMTIPTYSFIVAAVVLLSICHPADMIAKASADLSKLPLIIIGSILSQAVPYVCYSNALKYMESSTASIMVSFEVVMASLYGVMLYGEKLDIFNVTGIFCIIAAVVLLEAKKVNKFQ